MIFNEKKKKKVKKNSDYIYICICCVYCVVSSSSSSSSSHRMYVCERVCVCVWHLFILQYIFRIYLLKLLFFTKCVGRNEKLVKMHILFDFIKSLLSLSLSLLYFLLQLSYIAYLLHIINNNSKIITIFKNL